MIRERGRQLLISGINLVLASLVAGFIAYWVLGYQHEKGSKKCGEKPCYVALEKRILIMETAMQCHNNSCDRFKGKDARALEDRIRQDMLTLCGEVNKRIDAMHKEP